MEYRSREDQILETELVGHSGEQLVDRHTDLFHRVSVANRDRIVIE